MEKQEETFISKKGQLLSFMPAEAVAYPGQTLNLCVKVPAYLRLIRVCEQNEKAFGILPIIERQLFGYGCTVRTVSVDRKSDGSAMVVLKGEKIFRLVEFFNENECNDEIYPMGFIKYLQQNNDEKEVSFAVYEKVFNIFCKIANIFREKGGCDLLDNQELFDSLMLGKKKSGRMSSYYMVNKLLGLHLCEKAALLAIKSEGKRLKALYFQMKNLVSVLEKVFRD